MHHVIVLDSTSQTNNFNKQLLSKDLPPGFKGLTGENGALFSSEQVTYYLEKEEKHGIKIITKNTTQSLITMSSGERKRVLLDYLLQKAPDYIVLVNPYDNLDQNYQKELKEKLVALADTITFVQLLSRFKDMLPLESNFARLKGKNIVQYKSKTHFLKSNPAPETHYSNFFIPRPLKKISFKGQELVKFKNVSVSYLNKQILSNITWRIKRGDFWQLKGPNGSGKTTLLTMITGDNPKAYGQDLFLFGTKKGSGESVWEVKKNIGYFTPAMVDKFSGYHTAQNMLISGLHDSVGLYIKPNESEKNLAFQWLQLLNLAAKKDKYFHQLSTIEKRVLLTARAMIKHPLLLILDEPTAGLDDTNASLFVALVNKIAAESSTTIIFVSHREEKKLLPKSVFELVPTEKGAIGKIAPN